MAKKPKFEIREPKSKYFCPECNKELKFVKNMRKKPLLFSYFFPQKSFLKCRNVKKCDFVIPYPVSLEELKLKHKELTELIKIFLSGYISIFIAYLAIYKPKTSLEFFTTFIMAAFILIFMFNALLRDIRLEIKAVESKRQEK